MKKKVRAFLEMHHMIERGDHVVAGVSGGADSVCLLLVLNDLRKELGFTLTAVHVEHGIRGSASMRDAHFVRELCAREHVELTTCSVDAIGEAKASGQSLEEAARRLRYACFCREALKAGNAKIAVAHHGDDCAETMLFHLSRGTGLRGLCGIVPVRTITPALFGADGDGEELRLIRPLMCAARSEVEQYLRERQQEYCTDDTNEDTFYARNRIRQNIMPELLQINPRSVEHMVRTAGYLEEVRDYLDEAAWREGREGVLCTYEGGRVSSVRIAGEHFAKLHSVLKDNLIHRLLGLAAGSRKDITDGHIRAVRGLLDRPTGKSVSLPCGLEAFREYGDIVIRRVQGKKCRSRTPQELSVPGETLLADGTVIAAEIRVFDENFEKIPKKTYTKWFDYDKIMGNVLLRGRQPGDFFQVDAAGGHKKLKDYFIDEKVPRDAREEVLLLAEGSHVIWAVGYRVSEAYKVTQKTKRVLEVRVSGGKIK